MTYLTSEEIKRRQKESESAYIKALDELKTCPVIGLTVDTSGHSPFCQCDTCRPNAPWAPSKDLIATMAATIYNRADVRSWAEAIEDAKAICKLIENDSE